ncbi:CYFA0S29e01046g1_1 [Cyberlindnera fabianii]|uniref:CYFA0S29e01046g1_1 n=1 Tax=Cyberlindnera fabianii TaxID=36022 RepID=A0A061BB18_CYBFA|nr:CYFA0S29e01046g1_1 [Cyberlindnera fabianii]
MLAAAVIGAASQETVDPNWVTYTKPLGSTTVTVTNYLGSTPLTGSLYTTDTVVVSENGVAAYTKYNTRMKNSAELAAEAATVTTSSSAAVITSAASSSDDGWVTYTKDLGSTTIVVTRYVGSSALTGTEYTTRVVTKLDSDGNPQYTETIVGHASAADSSAATSSAVITSAPESSSSSGDGWVTYTKDLGSTTIVVTRYVGSSALTGSEYTTRVITKLDSDGNPQYTETIIGYASAAESSTSESSAVVSSSAVAGYQNGTLATSTVTADEISTTLVTITSCSEGECSETAVTTGLTVVTTTSEGVVTEYTTYCPLSSETESSTGATTQVTSVNSGDVTSTNTIIATSTEGSVSTFEGAAGAVGVSVGALALAVVALF